MGREARANDDGTAFHVVVRSADELQCFASIESKASYMECLYSANQKYSINLLAYCIMKDHAHVVIVCGGADTLSGYMTYVNAKFAKWFNIHNERQGKVFKDRFRSQALKTSQEIADCVKFVHSDPLRLKVVDRIEEYRASSYYDYITSEGIVDYDYAARYFNPSASAISRSITHINFDGFIDTELRLQDSEEEIFGRIIDKYRIESETQLADKELVKTVAQEIISVTGMSMREVAIKLGVNREKLRRILKEDNGVTADTEK